MSLHNTDAMTDLSISFIKTEHGQSVASKKGLMGANAPYTFQTRGHCPSLFKICDVVVNKVPRKV